MLDHAQSVWGESESDTSVGNDEELEDKDDHPDNKEGPVSGNSLEHIELVMDFA